VAESSPIKTKEVEAELRNVTAPAVTITKERVSDYSATTTTLPVETKVVESELKKLTEPAAAVTKEQVPGSAANGKLSTPIPSLAVNQPESIGKIVEGRGAALAGSSAEGTSADKVDIGSQAVGKEDVKRAETELQSQEVTGQATAAGPISGEAKPSEGITAQEASATGAKAANNIPDVSQLQSTIAQAKEKSAELEKKTKEFERKKGGLFGWLKRKIRGEKAEK
jgi:hypothetical protein